MMNPHVSHRLSLMAKLFIVIIFITVFEGAFRKWGSNLFTYPLVGLRDVLALIGICYGLANGYARRMPQLTIVIGLLSFMVFLWGLIQVLINELSPLIYLIGLRFWLLYLCFATLAACALTVHEFRVIVRCLIMLLLAMTPLVVFQHFQPPGSFWNKQVDESVVFTVAGDVVRTTGIFSFTAGYTAFMGLVTPLVLLTMDSRYQIWRKAWMSWLCVAALLICTIVSGSRGAIIFTGLMLLLQAVLIMSFGSGKDRFRALGSIVLIGVITLLLLLIFSRAVDATLERFELASQSESLADRLAYNFLPQGEQSVFGAGLGMGSNVAAQFMGYGDTFLLAETENARVILELGALGWIVLLVKLIGISLALYFGARLARRKRRGGVMLLWLSCGLALLSWSIVGQLTINALGYLLLGLALLALRLEREGQLQ